jgi:hypothetical protein
MRLSKKFTNQLWLKIRCESFCVRFHSFAQKGYGTSEKTVSSILTHINLPLEPAFSAYEDRQSPLMAHQVVVEKHTASFNETTFNVAFASQSLPAPHESKTPRRNLVVDLKRKSCDLAGSSLEGRKRRLHKTKGAWVFYEYTAESTLITQGTSRKQKPPAGQMIYKILNMDKNIYETHLSPHLTTTHTM